MSFAKNLNLLLSGGTMNVILHHISLPGKWPKTLKNFGYMSSRKALNIDSTIRSDYVQSLSENASAKEQRMNEVLKDYKFYYPVMDLMCGGDRNMCRIYNKDGLLISTDGSHLTKEGAIEMGIILRPMLEVFSSDK